VQSDAHLRESAGDLVQRCIEEAARLIAGR
jgi:hypothetical protein